MYEGIITRIISIKMTILTRTEKRKRAKIQAERRVRYATDQSSTLLNQMLDMNAEGGSPIQRIVDFIPVVPDLCNVASCSRQLRDICKLDPRRFMQRFLTTYSKSIWFHWGIVDEYEFLDDQSSQIINKMRDHGIEDNFKKFATSERHMVESVVAWCGGWNIFTSTRLLGATTLAATSSSVPAASKIDHLCHPVIIYDIYCDGEWVWSGLHPLTSDDLRTLQNVETNDDDDNWSVFYPCSMKTLGDRTISGTAYGWNHGTRRPSRYLLSTDSNDNRTYTFRVSMVSPNFAEVLIVSNKIVPADIVGGHEDWITASKSYNSWVARDEAFQENPQLLMAATDDFHTLTSRRIPQLAFTFYRQKKDEECNEERFHVVMDCWFPTTFFYNTMVPPPADNATSTMVTNGYKWKFCKKSLKGKLLKK